MAIKKGLTLEEAFKALNGRALVKESAPIKEEKSYRVTPKYLELLNSEIREQNIDLNGRSDYEPIPEVKMEDIKKISSDIDGNIKIIYKDNSTGVYWNDWGNWEFAKTPAAVKESVDADSTSVAAFNSPAVFADIIAKKIMLEMKFEDIGDGHGQGFGCIVADPLKEGTALLYEAISNGVLVLRKLDVAQFKKVLELYSRGASLEVIKIESKKYTGDDKIFDPYYKHSVDLKNVRRSDPGIEVVPFEEYVQLAEQDDE